MQPSDHHLSHCWRHLPSLLPVLSHLRLGAPISPEADSRSSAPLVFDLEAIERGLTSERSLLASCEIIPDEEPDARDVASWSEALVRRGVRRLMIDFTRFSSRPDASSLVAHCKSLDKLDLRACSLLRQNPVGCIFLTHLRLMEVKISDEMLQGFASRCKSLICLEMSGCHGFKDFKLEDARRLKRLSFQYLAETAPSVVERIEIEAPELEVLDLRTVALEGGGLISSQQVRTVC